MTIDLSKIVGKKARMTLRDGSEREVEIFKSAWPMLFQLSSRMGIPLYGPHGKYLSDSKTSAYIIKIEEIKVGRYEELERQVVEL